MRFRLILPRHQIQPRHELVLFRGNEKPLNGVSVQWIGVLAVTYEQLQRLSIAPQSFRFWRSMPQVVSMSQAVGGSSFVLSRSCLFSRANLQFADVVNALVGVNHVVPLVHDFDCVSVNRFNFHSVGQLFAHGVLSLSDYLTMITLYSILLYVSTSNTPQLLGGVN